MERAEKLTLLELLCVFFWFMFDGFWLMEWALATYIGSFISLALAVAIFFYIERELVAVLIAVVDTFWLIVNTFWAIFDFTKITWTHDVAKVSFWIGTVLFVLAFMVGKPGKRIFQMVLLRFRIFKLLSAK